ncbi:hypothetical protein ACFQDD_04415, partial [Halorubrum pallidum]
MAPTDSPSDAREEIADRTIRALTESMSVTTLDGTPVDDPETTVVSVTTESGSCYDVDTREGRCSCPDAQHRDPDGGCKHVRRARFALGSATVSARMLRVFDVDPTLGANAPGPR